MAMVGETAHSDLPLFGIKVLDLSRILAGPLSTMVLGDLGADVLKVEHPVGGDGTRDWGIELSENDTSYFYAFNRNKRSITADLSRPEDQTLILRLAEEADVLVENFRFGTMEKFGLGYESLKRKNPALVYCAVSGYDSYGPEARRPGYDLVLQGESGIMATNGAAGNSPLKFGVPVVDIMTGMSAAQAVLGALLKAKMKGVGTKVDIALYDVGVVTSTYFGLEALLQKSNLRRYGNFHSAIVPYGVFDAQDGSFVLAAGNTRQFIQMCTNVLARADLAEDPRFKTNLDRVHNRDELQRILKTEFAKHRRAQLLEGFLENQIPAGEVEELFDALTSSRASEAGLVRYVDHPEGGSVPVFAPSWRLNGVRPEVSRPPQLGEHNAPRDQLTPSWLGLQAKD